MDMQGGSTLVFGINILNLKGYLGKGTKREQTHTLIDVQMLNLLPKTLSKISQSFLNVHTTRRTTSLFLNVFGYFVFLNISCGGKT